MASLLAEAHIEGQRRLRAIIASVVGQGWSNLGSWDRADVDRFLAIAVPAVTAGQRASVALTEAYLARFVGAQPSGLDPRGLIGAAVRNGVPPEEVYARPFVTLWSALKDGQLFADALRFGLDRATSTAEMDIQLSMRATTGAFQEATDGVYGYQRVADGGACDFCLELDGAYIKDGDASPLHNRCGCGVEPLTDPHPNARWLPDGSEAYGRGAVAVNPHGELGPVIGDPADHFTAL